jgi:hypothetical protein
MAVCLAVASERSPASSDLPILEGSEPTLAWIDLAGLSSAKVRGAGYESLGN